MMGVMAKDKNYHLLHNSRFYILAASFLLSVAVAAYLRLQIPGDQLYYIRMQQVFGLLCIFYWYFALVISPIGHVIGKHRTKRLEFARRAIGVSAFYFALLHGVVALWGQLGGLGQLYYLPLLFKWSLLGGGIALGILAIMAATSFDRVISFMTLRKWKWLHRLVYIGGVLAVLHVWSVGTHLAYSNIQIAAFIALVVLGGLEWYRTTKLVNNTYLHFDKTEAATLFIAGWIVIATLVLAIPLFVQNYHSRHDDHAGETHSQGGEHP